MRTGGMRALFAVAPDGELGRLVQPAPEVAWSGWTPAGARVASAPAAFDNIDGRMEVFAKGPSGRLEHSWQLRPEDIGAWSDWIEIGPEISHDPAVFPNPDGHLEVFAVGPDGTLGHSWQLDPGGAAGWADWDSFDQEIRSSPVPIRNVHDRIEVFAIGADGCLGHTWQQRGLHGGVEWANWGSFGYELHSPPAVCRQADGRLEVFAIGPDGRLGHIWQEADPGGSLSWSHWGSFGHEISGPPALIRTAAGGLQVFAIGADGCLGQLSQYHDPGGLLIWSDWGSFGQKVRSSPVVARNSEGMLEVYAIGEDGRFGHMVQWTDGEEIGWSPWESLGVEVSEHTPALCPSGVLVGVELAPRNTRTPVPAPELAPPTRGKLSADFCVIGAGPAGITLAAGLVDAGADVVLVESGGWNDDPDAQMLNLADADGPIIKHYLGYLRDSRVRQVQGSAAIWGLGWCMPFGAIDYEARDWVPMSGWPFDREELAPYEERAAATFDFEPFTHPEANGSLSTIEYHYPPNALLFRAKLVQLLTAPNFRLELDATVVEMNVKGERVESVRCARRGGGELLVKAGTTILAAGGVENARQLLLHEGVLPVVSPMTGRCFMEHPHVVVGTAHFPDSGEVLSRLYLHGGQRSLEVFVLPDETQRSERLLNTMIQVRQASHHLTRGPIDVSLYARAEQAPNLDSRVTLADRVDRFGCRRPYLHWELEDDDWTSIVRTAELVASALQEEHGAHASLSVTADAPWPMQPGNPHKAHDHAWGNHHMGTTRMADDPANGPVDADCRLHGVENLYLAGSSVFPTGGCANPTFTIIALAHRLQDHLAAP
jgi:choline dehydrogenase-like flavoprotein